MSILLNTMTFRPVSINKKNDEFEEKKKLVSLFLLFYLRHKEREGVFKNMYFED